MSETPILTLEGVTKSFGPVTVIDGVTVNVRPGKVQVLLGENGAGKSTLIKMMSEKNRTFSGSNVTRVTEWGSCYPLNVSGSGHFPWRDVAIR
ncbi:ATP-binding cassette domain-containing protein [Arthrobacter sp. ATA002]|uniref:ATP-binding cassette domain-containing protein n=1 Tax=Arthrobacter sp. ATA002 TaxID=2991715 RepID=UPI0022A66754|nr:ATP-binding cassette domain-containing protein [Arthrobacter sp. ATA002]WAP51240.1 ATP-binding cassette domain-containing protein [Arthrobacter sp. ATA002]